MKALVVIILVVAATWCAGNVILGAVAAPGIFAHAVSTPTLQPDHVSRELAGKIFGEILRRWSHAVDIGFLPLLGVLILLLAGALLNLKRIGLMVVCMVALGSIAGVHLWSSATLDQALASAPPIDPKTPYGAEQREIFNALHKHSTTAFSTEALLLLVMVIGCGIALGRQADAVSTSAAKTNH